jgi:uncharacterized membrane protein YdjX (TVP38/TMEM64 family)
MPSSTATEDDPRLDPAEAAAVPAGRPSLLTVVITLAGIGLLALLVLLIDPLRDAVTAAVRGDTEQVEEEVDRLGVGGPLIVLALCLVHAFVWYPAEIIDAAAGFVFGFWAALPLMMAGWLLNGWVCYAIGQRLARPLLHRLIGAERFERAEVLVERGGVTLLIAIRLVPIFPFSLMSYACGAARVPLWRFTWTILVGYLPITAISVYLGSRLEDLSLTDPLVIGSVAAVVAMLLAARWLRPGNP